MKAILDASAVMNSSILPEIKHDMVIPQITFDEIKSQQAKNILEVLASESKLSIVTPLRKFIQIVMEETKKIGQNKLSKQDISVLATAIMLMEHDDVIIYSDDYGVRNVAHHMNISSEGITTKGGKQKRKYKYQCAACGAIYKELIQDCDICGHTNFKRLRR